MNASTISQLTTEEERIACMFDARMEEDEKNRARVAELKVKLVQVRAEELHKNLMRAIAYEARSTVRAYRLHHNQPITRDDGEVLTIHS